MTASAWLHKNKALFFIGFVIVFATFTPDILDLREELHILSCPYNSLDNNVSTGLTSTFVIEPEGVPIVCTIQQNTSVEISFLHLLPHGFRAPPSWS
jgi:hypothetical protein